MEISSARATNIEVFDAGRKPVPASGGANWKRRFEHDEPFNNGKYTVRVKNANGYNSGTFPFEITVLDKQAPVITKTTIHPANDVWATSKTLKVTATDQTNVLYSLRYEDGSPVPNCPDKEGSINGSVFEASWTIAEYITTSKAFRVIATDQWGYSSDTTATISWIDNKKPSKPALSINGGDWYNTDMIATISGGSAASGINHYEYRVNGGAWQTGSTAKIFDEGIHNLEAKAISGSGLESDVESVTVKIDKTKPTANYTLTPEVWTTDNVIINLFPNDNGGSALASVTLPNGKTIYDNLANIQYSAYQNGDYQFTIKDNAGNTTIIVVPVHNIAMLDVTVTLTAPFVISPDNDRLYSGGISFQNYSNVPIKLALHRMTAYENAPQLVGRDEKAWKNLSVAETRKYIALGFAGNGVDFWVDTQESNHPYSFGSIAKGGSASYSMQGRFGYAWEQAEQFTYGMALKVSIAS